MQQMALLKQEEAKDDGATKRVIYWRHQDVCARAKYHEHRPDRRIVPMRSFLSLVLLGTLRAKKKEEVKRVIANNWISFEGAGCGGAILSSRARRARRKQCGRCGLF